MKGNKPLTLTIRLMTNDDCGLTFPNNVPAPDRIQDPGLRDEIIFHTEHRPLAAGSITEVLTAQRPLDPYYVNLHRKMTILCPSIRKIISQCLL